MAQTRNGLRTNTRFSSCYQVKIVLFTIHSNRDFRRLAIVSAKIPIPSSPNVLGSGTPVAAASTEIAKSVPTKVAKLVGLINSSAMTSSTEIARPVRAAAPPEPDNKSNGEDDVNESRPDTLPPVKTPPFSVILQSELRF